MTEDISVVLATYNGEKHLEAQLESLLAQTIIPTQIIISDDMSSDLSFDIAKKYLNRHYNGQVLYQRNATRMGYTKNFEQALRLATGDYIFLCDQDDYWHPKKIEYMMEILSDDPNYLLAIHDLEVCDEYLQPIGQRMMDRLSVVGKLARDYNIGMATVCKKALLDVVLPIPDTSLWDFDNWIHFCAESLGVKRVVDVPLASYRRHSDSATAILAHQAPRRLSHLQILIEYVCRVSRKDRNASDLRGQKRALEDLVSWIDAIDLTRSDFEIDRSRVLRARDEAIIKVAYCEERDSIRKKPKILRPYYIARMFLAGKYKSFNGWKAAVKDLIL